jgi:hypothetical protein
VIGDLTNLPRAALPVTAAMCGGAFGRIVVTSRLRHGWRLRSLADDRRLAYGQGSADEHVTRAMLVSFVIDAALAAVVLVGATEGIASST